MAKILRGKEVADTLTDAIKKDVEYLKQRGVTPTLAIVRVGEKGGDIAYERGASKRAETTGVEVRKCTFDSDISQDILLKKIRELNEDRDIHGVLILRPLPKHIDDTEVRKALAPIKDLDGITDISMAGIYSSTDLGFSPCTPGGCMEILDYYGIDPAGKKAVILGRSLVVGKPLAMMLMKRNATVTVCHTKTSKKDLIDYCQKADLIFVTAGSPKAISGEHVRAGQVIIDIGINVGADGKMCGDVDFEAAEPVVEAITPVPGGVGATTSTMLMKHLVTAAKNTALVD